MEKRRFVHSFHRFFLLLFRLLLSFVEWSGNRNQAISFACLLKMDSLPNAVFLLFQCRFGSGSIKSIERAVVKKKCYQFWNWNYVSDACACVCICLRAREWYQGTPQQHTIHKYAVNQLLRLVVAHQSRLALASWPQWMHEWKQLHETGKQESSTWISHSHPMINK